MQFVKLTGFIIILSFVFSQLLAVSEDKGDSLHKLREKQFAVRVSNVYSEIPVLTMKSESPVIQIRINLADSTTCVISKINLSLKGTTDIRDIESLKIVYTGDGSSSDNCQYGVTISPAISINFSDRLVINKPVTYFQLFVKLKTNTDLLHLIQVTGESVETISGAVIKFEKTAARANRIGVALKQRNEDNVGAYRIPGLTTTTKGTLLAIYDVRRNGKKDLQGDIDIGVSRSMDGGKSWAPTQIVLDKGNWGGLPQKFNGVSDPCILVNEQNNDIFIAGLWMHGVLDKNGKWVEGLNNDSVNWQHQWRGKGSQPGFGEKETCQFLVTKSSDDGRTWSEPINLTGMCKKREWWLLAPAPGHGITLNDGTLVFPTQGRDSTGRGFSNITWSKDNGTTWTTSNAAGNGTTENMVAQLSDGSIMINMRDGTNRTNSSATNGRVIAVSQDLGNTWTIHPTSRSSLIEPACMASLHKHNYTENGEKKSILLFSNPNSKSGRNHMTIKVSFDDGASWPEKNQILIDQGLGRGYSCLTSVDEQTIGILYEGSQSDLIFQKIALGDLIRP